jgi:hypothetical protein
MAIIERLMKSSFPSNRLKPNRDRQGAQLHAVRRAYSAAGDKLRARQAFERAVRLEPNNKRATDALALLRRQ